MNTQHPEGSGNLIKKLRSFCKGFATKRNAKIALVCAAVVIVSLCSSGYARVEYSVEVNGETVGTFSEKAEAESFLNTVQTRAGEVLGNGYTLGEKASITSFIETSHDTVTGAKDIGEIIVDNFEEITRCCAVSIDGNFAAAVEDEKTVNEVVDAIISRYTDSGIILAKTVEEITCEEKLMQTGEILTKDQLSELLNPDNTNSPFALTVRTTRIINQNIKVAFAREEAFDDELYEGNSYIRTEGVDGDALEAHYIVYYNGVQASDEIIDTKIVAAPVNEVVVYGTKERPPTASYGEFIWPTTGILTSRFGPRNVDIGSSDHKGIDIAGSYGDEIWAADGGVVTLAQWWYGYGNFVMILHDDGTETCYGHCCEILVEEGERVARGQVIARQGETGVASGVHCHFEVRVGGEAVDPLKFLP